MDEHTIGVCSSAGCRNGIYPTEEAGRCSRCGRLICVSCRLEGVKLCSRCEMNSCWVEAHNLYNSPIRHVTEAAMQRRKLLEELIKTGLIPPGELRDRIVDNIATDAFVPPREGEKEKSEP